MSTLLDIPDKQTEFLRTIRAVKAARLAKGLSREEAGKLLGWKAVSFEQIENGRCNFSTERLQKILAALGYSQEEFSRIKHDPNLVVAEACETGKSDKSVTRKPRRNYYKIVTKEVRVIRVLRQRKRISQHEASRLCGYVPGGFGHIEVGRIELSKARIEHILRSLSYEWRDFELLMNAPLLRDEVILEATVALQKLNDQALASALSVIKALQK